MDDSFVVVIVVCLGQSSLAFAKTPQQNPSNSLSTHQHTLRTHIVRLRQTNHPHHERIISFQVYPDVFGGTAVTRVEERKVGLVALPLCAWRYERIATRLPCPVAMHYAQLILPLKDPRVGQCPFTLLVAPTIERQAGGFVLFVTGNGNLF